MRIAILHHDTAEATRIAAMVERAGHVPVPFPGGQALHDALSRDYYPALVMRWDGAGLCGVALMHRLQARLATPPAIIMLIDASAPGAIAENADQLLADPCSEAALASALAAVASRRKDATPRQEQFDDLLFDGVTGQAQVRGKTVALTAKEFALALLLLRNCGQAIARDQIMVSVWGRHGQPGSRTLDAHVAQVRKRLQLRPEYGWRLSNVYGFGYRLDRVDPVKSAAP